MLSFRRQIGPLSAVFAFEAAARHLSFSRAAEELGVTQAAVSKQIASFEAHLGTKLFSRNHRSVSLTREGRELNRVVHMALKDVAAAARAIAGPQETHLTIALSTTLSQFWLMPRPVSYTHLTLPTKA